MWPAIGQMVDIANNHFSAFFFFNTQKMLLKNAGMKGQKTVFLLTDTQIKEEAFLEDVDSVLNTGEVPNLFAMDEKQEIMEVIPKHTC